MLYSARDEISMVLMVTRFGSGEKPGGKKCPGLSFLLICTIARVVLRVPCINVIVHGYANQECLIHVSKIETPYLCYIVNAFGNL